MRIVIAEDSVLLQAGLERMLTDAGHGEIDVAGMLRQLAQTERHGLAVDLFSRQVHLRPGFPPPRVQLGTKSEHRRRTV